MLPRRRSQKAMPCATRVIETTSLEFILNPFEFFFTHLRARNASNDSLAWWIIFVHLQSSVPMVISCCAIVRLPVRFTSLQRTSTCGSTFPSLMHLPPFPGNAGIFPPSLRSRRAARFAPGRVIRDGMSGAHYFHSDRPGRFDCVPRSQRSLTL